MASSPSITMESTPKHTLPTKQPAKGDNMGRCLKWPPSNNASPSHFQKIVAEIIGTYILIFVGCAAILIDRTRSLTIVGIALVWGLVLMAMIYTVGHISGAHFNPAVTLAFAAIRKLPWKQVPMYVLAQILGATLASLTLRVLFHEQGNIQATMTQYNRDKTSDLEAITWEFLVTFILMFTISAVATDHRVNKDIAGVAVGVTLLFNVIISGPITGASMNPARSLGPALVSGVYKNLWVYIVAPILGALAAVMLYSVLRVPEPVAEKPEEAKSTYNQLYRDHHTEP